MPRFLVVSCRSRFRTIRRMRLRFSAASPLRTRLSGEGHVQHAVDTILDSPVPVYRGAQGVGAVIRYALSETAPVRRQTGRPLRVRRATFLPYTRRIYAESVRMASGFGSMRPLARQRDASYAIRVPRAGSLPSASFRFRLATDTLAVRLGVPAIKASTGTSTRQVTSRFAFARRLPASGHDATRHA